MKSENTRFSGFFLGDLGVLGGSFFSCDFSVRLMPKDSQVDKHLGKVYTCTVHIDPEHLL